MPFLQKDYLNLIRTSIQDYFSQKLTSDVLSELENDCIAGNKDCPGRIAEILHDMLSEKGLGIGLLAIPQEYGGLAAGLPGLLAAGEALGRHDLGIATGVLATLLAAAPVFYGGTPEQKKRIAEIIKSGGIGALSATEASGGSSLSSLCTKAELKDSSYIINGRKQWISNAGIADFYVVLAKAEGGESWFIVDKNAHGISFGKPEKKHGQNLSITAGIQFDNVVIGRECLLGGIEGKGIKQAAAAFDLTRMIVASLALGTGSAAIDEAVDYARSRKNAAGSLLNNESYTKELILPHYARLEAIRQYFAATADFIFQPSDGNSLPDMYSGNLSLSAESALAKFFAAEECLSACNAAVQACGGAGISRSYPAGKRLADCRPLLIYEGADEILKISLFRHRWQDYLKSGGKLYLDKAGLIAGPEESGCDIAAKTLSVLSVIMEICRKFRLARDKYLALKIGEIIAWTEISAAFSYMAQNYTLSAKKTGIALEFAENFSHSLECEQYFARFFAREALHKAYFGGLAAVFGASSEAGKELSASFSVIFEEISSLLADNGKDFMRFVDEICSF